MILILKELLSPSSPIKLALQHYNTYLTVKAAPTTNRAVAVNEAAGSASTILSDKNSITFCTSTTASGAVNCPLTPSASSSPKVAKGAEVTKMVLDYSVQEVIKPVGTIQIQLQIKKYI